MERVAVIERRARSRKTAGQHLRRGEWFIDGGVAFDGQHDDALESAYVDQLVRQ